MDYELLNGMSVGHLADLCWVQKSNSTPAPYTALSLDPADQANSSSRPLQETSRIEMRLRAMHEQLKHV